jgi:transposase
LIRVPVAVLFSAQGRAWLNQLALSESDRLMLEGHLRRIDQLETDLASVEKHLAEISYPCQEVRLLMTLPGMGAAAAQGLWAALGDWRRFRDGDQAASYLGLVPSTHQSASSCRHGSITKAGNSHTRWLLTRAAQHLALHAGPLGVFFRRLARRKNHNIAVVAAARKLVVIGWQMLKHGEPYRYSLPDSTRAKLSAFRVLATGQRRKKGPLRERPQRRAPGERVHHSDGLNEIYASEGLPPAATPERLAAGERRALEASGLGALPQAVQTPQRRLSRRQQPPRERRVPTPRI